MTEEIEIKLSVQLAMRVAELEARIQVANRIMKEVMDAYKRVCDSEQQYMDNLMSSICNTEGKALPPNYEYAFDPNQMTLSIRTQQPTPIPVNVPMTNGVKDG